MLARQAWILLICALLALSPGCRGAKKHPRGSEADADIDTDADTDADSDTDTDPVCVDIDGDGYFVGPGCEPPDCDDRQRLVNPGQPEVCGDEIDNNCSGAIDEGCSCSSGDIKRGCYSGPPESCAAPGGCYGECRRGHQICESGAWGTTCHGEQTPTPERCDGKDNDCDGTLDNGFPRKGSLCTRGLGECRREGAYVCAADGRGLICDAPVVHGSPEVCDGRDNDCNGFIDDNGVCLGEEPDAEVFPDADADEQHDTDEHPGFDPDIEAEHEVPINPRCSWKPRYIVSHAECAFQLAFQDEFPCSWVLFCLPQPCQTDLDCFQIPTLLQAGRRCVAGNCVFCWNDEQCPAGLVCRAGQCLETGHASCPFIPPWYPCSDTSCNLAMTSEDLCTTCLCDTHFRVPCTNDLECLAISHHPFQRCVYGRCAECRKDLDCPYGLTCIQPGLCSDMFPHPERLYGAWLIGWGGGMDHFSYFRFEPDGTFRYGPYEHVGAWSDDIAPLEPCEPTSPASPAMGTWEPLLTDSAQLAVRISLNQRCSEDDGGRAYWTFVMDGDRATVYDVGGSGAQYEAYRVEMESCDPDFRRCDAPTGYPP